MRFLSSEGWKAKSKPASVLIAVSRAIISAVLIPPVLAHGELLDQDLVERADGVDLALLDAAHGLVEHLERARHAQGHQASLDAVERGGLGIADGGAHGRPPAPAAASLSPIAW